ncbi:hypothetical protein FFF34_013800 [Inquilinus sp. KBS0705]|nr:hypothetical protein FFF34_013800 [Inquilinus sp. KBS0705]
MRKLLTILVLLVTINCSAQQQTQKDSTVEELVSIRPIPPPDTATKFIVYRNNQINKRLRNKIKNLNDTLLSAYLDNDTSKLHSMYSDRSKIQLANFKSLEESFPSPVFKVERYTDITEKRYRVLDEFSYRSNEIGKVGVIVKDSTSGNGYKFKFFITQKNTYISLLICPGENREFLLASVYCKYGNTWKMEFYAVLPYSIKGITAVDFYKLARQYYGKGYLLDTYNNIILSARTISPFPQSFNYTELPAMKKFEAEVFKEMAEKYPMPIKLSKIPTMPEIVYVSPFTASNGIFTSITYITKIPLQNTAELTAENEEIKKILVELFPGIEKGKKYVYLKALNELPSVTKKTVQSYGFILRGDSE